METLKIETAKRDTVNIDGTEFELKNTSEFSFEFTMKIADYGKIVESMDFSKKNDRKKFTSYLNKVIKAILIAPKKIRVKLSDNNKVEIIKFFLEQKKKRDQ